MKAFLVHGWVVVIVVVFLETRASFYLPERFIAQMLRSARSFFEFFSSRSQTCVWWPQHPQFPAPSVSSLLNGCSLSLSDTTT